MFGISALNQTSKEQVTAIRLRDRECATIGKVRQWSVEENPNMAVLVERVGVPDDYALYSVLNWFEINFGTEVRVIVEFLAGSSSDFTHGAEYQISITAL